ncbi:hypothetical protein COCCU_00740 [Corynebacterium occultum]|uniref:YdhG-like domain-containing protein n=1 Tax=Corynebacterium occultum TaxID=2675219 RepID=A0A6B8W5B8_9CORY|nr:DUF1801 domain-containing protein [Corynebacterium occultum]QGU06116.1 hypothetical protein COCCU_00740 [Corynebacterium occultum]
MSTSFDQVKGTARPLHRALVAAGYPDLESLHDVPHEKLAALHGVGSRGLERIQAALLERGLSLRGEIPTTAPGGARITAGHTGKNAADIKTHPTEVDPVEYIESLDTPRRVEHGRQLLEIFNRVTGEKPVMWGPSMIGYGQVHYESHTGREGDWFHLGFSPRKAKLTLYGLKDSPGSEELLPKLGKYTVGAGCIYLNKPEDIDLEVLAEMIAEAWRNQPED